MRPSDPPQDGSSRCRFFWLLALALVLGLGFWLRRYKLGAQVVLDDEWHAIHKLMTSDYAAIFSSFGHADHSIPLTMLYKWIAEHGGLTEINMRLAQVYAGFGVVVAGTVIAWRATWDRAVTLLYAILLAGAPFLVFYSRIARPYAITTLITLLALAGLWRWRTRRGLGLAAGICALVALAAWMHPVSALFPGTALLFVLAEDLAAGPIARRRVIQVVALGLAAAASMALFLAVPVMNDWRSLSGKAGDHFAGPYTLARMTSIFAGGFPDPVTVIVSAIAMFGAWRLGRSDRRLALYLGVLVAVPIVVLMMLGAQWTHLGFTFGRYAFPIQLIFLYWVALGCVALLQQVPWRHGAAVWIAAIGIGIAYLAATPTIRHVVTLGPWYGHILHHLDYVPRHNAALKQYAGFHPPEFYQRIARMPPGTATVIEAPFQLGAPANGLAFVAQFHRQREVFGLLYDLCLEGPRWGEPPRDGRFRFRNFVYLHDPADVLSSGARYLVLWHAEERNGLPFREESRCFERLSDLYGPPIERHPGVIAVFDLKAARERRGLK